MGEEAAPMSGMDTLRMETTICAERSVVVAEVPLVAGTQVDAGDLLLRYEK